MKRIFTLALSAMMLGAGSASAQIEYKVLQDLTSSKLVNADFSADQPVAATVYTYDYNMTDVEVGTSDVTKGLFGQQNVSGWTAANPSDNVRVMENDKSAAREDGANARAAGIFSYVDDAAGDPTIGLGGAYYPPYMEAGVAEGQSLGLVAVWGAEVKYTQDVTLPAGAYMMVAKLFNAAGTGTITNKMGFVPADSDPYLSSKTSYPVNEWVSDTIIFRLSKETAGQIALGFQFGAGSGSAPHLFIDNVKLFSIDEQQLIQAEIDAAKEELKALLDEGEKLNADTEDGYKVYNNANATMAEVQTAIENQKKFNDAAQTDLSAYFLKNAHFTADEPLPDDEGITTYDYDMKDPNGANERVVHYFGMQPITDWETIWPSDNTEVAGRADGNNGANGAACGVYSVGSNSFLGGSAFLPPTTMSDGSTEGKLLGFVTAWGKIAQYTQNVTLPAGQYTLEISYYNAGGNADEVSANLMGFVESNGTEHFGETKKWEVGKWIKDKIMFTLDEPTDGYFSVGYRGYQGSGKMPHFFIDGISIYFVGDLPMDASLLGLQAAVQNAQKVSGEQFNSDLRDQLDTAVEEGQQLINSNSSDEEANKAAADAITQLMAVVNTNIEAYKKLQAFADEGGALANALNTYDEVEGLYDKLGELSDNVADALDNYNWTTDEINEAMASLTTIIREGVQAAFDEAVASGKALKEPLDISILYDQMAYTYSTSAQSGANVPDKEWKYGDASNFKTQFGTAEVWSQSPFTVSRTLSNMPAGTYTIKTKAFYRTVANATNYANYQSDQTAYAFVFAGSQKTALANVAEIAAPIVEGEATTAGWTDANNELATTYGVSVPNNQESAHNIFENGDFTEKVEKSVKTALGSTGDLTFGVKGDQMESDSWVVWYTFSLAYDPVVDEDLLKQELAATIESFSTYLEENVDAMNGKAQEDAQQTITTANAALSGSASAMSAAIESIKAAQAVAEENVAAMTTFNTSLEALNTAAENYSETASETAMDSYNNILSEIGGVDNLTSEEITALAKKMDIVAADLKIPNTIATASDENPVNLTDLIVNPSYDEGNDNGWSYEGDAPGRANRSDMCEYYKKAFNYYQTLYNLPAGTYEITLNCYNRYNDNAKEDLTALEENRKDEVQSAFVYATVGDKTFSEPFRLISEGARTTSTLGDGGTASTIELADREPLYTPNNMVAAGYCFEETDEAGNPLGDEKNYVVRVVFTLSEKSNVTIGVKNALSSGWSIWDNWTLTSYGTSSSKAVSDDPMAIEGIAPATVKTDAIYNLAGQKVDANYKGIVIKNGKKMFVK